MSLFKKILCLGLLGFSLSLPAAESLKIGFINERPDEPNYILQLYSGLISQLSTELEPQGYSAEIVIAKDFADMLDKLQNGKVNVLSESVFSTLKFQQTGLVEPKWLAWRKGVRSYQSLFVVSTETRINNLEDLKGKRIVFESPRSTSAYALPKAYLQHAGFSIIPADSEQKTADSILYQFAGDEMTQAYQVVMGRVEAAAFSTNDWDETPPTVSERLKIIARTEPVLRWLFSVHKDLPEAAVQAFQSALLRISADPKAEAVLKQSLLTRFEALNEADQRSLAVTRELLKLIDDGS